MLIDDNNNGHTSTVTAYYAVRKILNTKKNSATYSIHLLSTSPPPPSLRTLLAHDGLLLLAQDLADREEARELVLLHHRGEGAEVQPDLVAQPADRE